MRFLFGGLCALLIASMLVDQPVRAAGSCDGLRSLSLPNVTITMATPVEAGPLAVNEAGAGPNARPIDVARPFCRVAATLKPSVDSDIKIELWLPSANWNGKFQAVGNGAFTGNIAYLAMAAALARGYAAASTDTGHAGGSASFALGHPEKLIDFAYRSEHEMTVKAKVIVNAF